MMDNTITQANDTLVNAPPPQSDLDKMFKGLGIDPFSFNQPKEKEPAPVLPTVNNNGGHLSMEDKQRYGFFRLQIGLAVWIGIRWKVLGKTGSLKELKYISNRS